MTYCSLVSGLYFILQLIEEYEQKELSSGISAT
jgi:hypothetical protein